MNLICLRIAWAAMTRQQRKRQLQWKQEGKQTIRKTTNNLNGLCVYTQAEEWATDPDCRFAAAVWELSGGSGNGSVAN